MQNRIKQLLAEDQLAEALQLAEKYCRQYGSADDHHGVLLLQSRLQDWETQSRQGLAPDPTEKNRIRISLLSLVDTLAEDYPRTTYRPVPEPDPNRQMIIHRPTEEAPMLIGFLVDVSSSMVRSLHNPTGQTRNRLETFLESLEELVAEARELCKDNENAQVLPLFSFFVLGFGFNHPIAFLIHGNQPKVRSLLTLNGKSEIASIKELSDTWEEQKRHVESLRKQMFGETPLLEALTEAERIIRQTQTSQKLTEPVILFVLSDGQPTDASPDQIRTIIQRLQQENVLIISCFLTDQDLVEYKLLPEQIPPHWPVDAQIMFDCASRLPANRTFYAYLSELGWNYQVSSRLFTQINESASFREFLKLVLTPLQQKNG